MFSFILCFNVTISTLPGCNVSRQHSSGLELICEKWSHSLLELDLSWATAARVLDAAVEALADASESKLKYELYSTSFFGF